MIDRTARAILVLLVGVLFALPAAAQDHGHGAASTVDETVHEAASGSPSLFSVDTGLMFWTGVTFVVVLIVLRLTAWGPLMKSLAERQRSIEGAIEEARRVKSEAEALLAKYETMLESARDESRAILDEARKDGQKVQEEIRERAKQEAEDFKARARREIDLAKDGAVREIWEQAATLSTELAQRILGRSIGGADHERLVHELLTDMRAELAEGNGSSGTRKG